VLDLASTFQRAADAMARPVEDSCEATAYCFNDATVLRRYHEFFRSMKAFRVAVLLIKKILTMQHKNERIGGADLDWRIIACRY
jgi:hypothetical protein